MQRVPQHSVIVSKTDLISRHYQSRRTILSYCSIIELWPVFWPVRLKWLIVQLTRLDWAALTTDSSIVATSLWEKSADVRLDHAWTRTASLSLPSH